MTMIIIHTYNDIASDLDLWREYVDPDLAVSDNQFDEMTVEQRIAFIVDIFGPEPSDAQIADDLGF